MIEFPGVSTGCPTSTTTIRPTPSKASLSINVSTANSSLTRKKRDNKLTEKALTKGIDFFFKKVPKTPLIMDDSKLVPSKSEEAKVTPEEQNDALNYIGQQIFNTPY